MPQDTRRPVPIDQIKVQYRIPLSPDAAERGQMPGQLGIDVPGYGPFIYQVGANDQLLTNVVELPQGMRVLRRGALDATNGVVNPYRGVDTLTYIDRETNERQFIPLSQGMNRAIILLGESPGSGIRGAAGFDRANGEYGRQVDQLRPNEGGRNREFDPRTSDALVMLGNHRFAVLDMDAGSNGANPLLPVIMRPLEGAVDRNNRPDGAANIDRIVRNGGGQIR